MEEKAQEGGDVRERKCPICGGKEYEWGEMRVGKDKPGEFVYFRPDGSVWEDGDVPVYLRRCGVCGNIQIFNIDS